eukprot:jgi/Bigna1/143899/aug1.82_g18607
MVVDSKGDLFVSDPYGFYTHDKHRIRQIRPNGEVTTFVGSIKSYGERDGVGTYAKGSDHNGRGIDKDRDFTRWIRIRVIEPLLRRDTPFDTTDLRLEVLNITVSRQGKSRIYKANLAKGNRPYDTEAATRPARGTGDQTSFSRGRGTGRRGGRGRRGAGGKRGASGVGNSDSDDVSD